jgi:tetratricopeptide (TPR) repeat protein
MKPGRNDPCPCGSGRKFKHCCGQVSQAPATTLAPAASAAPEALPGAEIGALVGLVDRNRLQDAEHRAVALLGRHPNAAMLWKILSVALMRQGKDALQALLRTAELMPHDAEAHGNLGVFLCDRQQWAQGLTSLRRALEIQPHNEQLLIDAANASRALGQARESIAFYQQALQINPRSVEAHNNLGNAFLQLGECEDAQRSYRRALELSPDNAEIHCNLANAQRQLGMLDDAMASSRRAIALDPTLSVAHNNLGLVLAGLGRRTEAVTSYRQALKLNPGYVEALSNLGAVLPELGQRREAISLFARAIELDPKRAETHVNLGNLMFEFRRVEDAEASYRRALTLEPRNAPAHAGLGASLRMQGRAADAEASCRAALDIEPGSVAALSLLGELRADRGQFAEAEAFLRRALAIDPGYPFAYFSIATNRKMTRDETAWLSGVEALLGKPLALRHEISLRYALGKYYDDTKQYDDAFGNYRLANELTKRYGVQYDRSALTARVDRIIESFDAAKMRELQAHGSLSERPVFIVGMPRSGTSLSEQILASHPNVFGAGELAFWQNALHAYETAAVGGQAAASLIPGMASDYLGRLAQLSGQALRVVDKMPQNFMAVGLIHAVFPRARIIHLLRHPIDTCLSIYFHYFSHLHPYANEFDNLAHYYREYLRISDHWRSVLPAGALLEVPYEALVEDQEQWSRRMLEFVGLPWDPSCLNFHQTDRVVITLSKWQVRQKINTVSAGRWRHYEKYVGPLLPLIELARSRAPDALAG